MAQIEQVAFSPRSIVGVYDAASPDELAEGFAWYSTAHTFALGMCERYGLTLDQAAGVIAALSPQVRWEINSVAADTLARTGHCTRVLPDNRAKALRILAGEDVATVLRCPKCARGVRPGHACSGDKVRAFYACIMAAGESDQVCVDRHAFDIAAGRKTDDRTRKLLDRVGGYDKVADAYRKAARVLGVSAAVVQAVTWVTWRNGIS